MKLFPLNSFHLLQGLDSVLSSPHFPISRISSTYFLLKKQHQVSPPHKIKESLTKQHLFNEFSPCYSYKSTGVVGRRQNEKLPLQHERDLLNLILRGKYIIHFFTLLLFPYFIACSLEIN